MAAATLDEVAAAVRSAADTLLSPRPHGDVLLAVRTDGRFHALTPASAEPLPMSGFGELDGDLAAAGDQPGAAPGPGDQAA